MVRGKYVRNGGAGAAHAHSQTTRSGFPLTHSKPASSNDNHRGLGEQGRADELDCLRGILAPELLAAAERRARHVGAGADRVLIQWGVIDEASYLKRLSRYTGVAIETLAGIERSDLPLHDRQIAQAAEYGLLPRWRNGLTIWTLAPRRLAARMLCRLVAQHPHLGARIRLASSRRLDEFLLHQTDGVLGRAAAYELQRRSPKLSAAPAAAGPRWRGHWRRGLGACSIAGLILLPPLLAWHAWSTALALWFMASIGLRLWASFKRRPEAPISPRLSDAQLPVYTVIAALYREASSVARLLHAIEAFDYPREKLQVILVLEPDDLATRAAVARLRPMPHVQVLIAPAFDPKTKPKALNCAVPFARGSFTAVFDAEDRPDPRQLRAALDAFRSHDVKVACAQASLCIHNVHDSWLTRMFAAEYAGQFDVFLPGLSALRMPLPLGGSSNHFRTAVLREVGGWDAWNVTEDADLGIRLARFGYRSVTFDSTTEEEAPIRFKAWLGQRSRWMKGWMQTWGVHMRQPARLWRQAGARGVLTLNLIIGGNLLSALAYPVLVLEAAGYLLAESVGVTPDWFFTGPAAPLHVAAVAAGFLSTVLIGLMGLARRGRLGSGWVLALTPIYWALLSLAAWRALWQLWREPYRWEKTEHGLTQAERPTPRAPRRTTALTPRQPHR